MEPPFKKMATGPDAAPPDIILYTNSKDDKKGWCRQKFREEWCSEPEFDGWLEAVPDDPFRAWCHWCQCTLSVGRSELLKHAQTQKHKRAMQDGSNPSHVLNILEPPVDGGTSAVTKTWDKGVGHHTLSVKAIDEGLLKAELAIAAFTVEHNLTDSGVQHLCELIGMLSKQPDVTAKVRMTRNKCSAIVRDVLAKSVHQELEEVLRQSPFSLILEEKTIGHIRVACFVARYFNTSRNKVRTELLEAISVEDDSNDVDCISLGEKLSGVLKERIIQRKIPLQNIIGIAADHNSFIFENIEHIKADLLSKSEDAMIFRFASGSIATIVSHALDALPSSLEQAMRYYGRLVTGGIPGRIGDAELRKVFSCLDLSGWLGSPECVGHLLSQLDSVASILGSDVQDGRWPAADSLLKEVVNPYAKAYLMFLSHTYPNLYAFEQLLRPEPDAVHQLLKMCREQFRIVCQHFMTPSAFMVDDLASVDPFAESSLLPLKDVFVGHECQEFLKRLDPEQNEEFLTHCRHFLQVATAELQARIPLDDEILSQLSFLDPDVALRAEGRHSLKSLIPLGKRFNRHINIARLDEQWTELVDYFSAADISELKKVPLDSMWGIISDMRNAADEFVFGELGKLAKIALSLPFADHDVTSITNVLMTLPTTDVVLSRMLDTVLPLRHSMQQDATECHKIRVTAKNRKFYMLDVAKKSSFGDDIGLYPSSNS